ncbi:MAG: hypothetical protein JSR73_16320 [Proteobacteria bacterium]|nr:hypothetical protein [Pseudomonadota bacterium]
MSAPSLRERLGPLAMAGVRLAAGALVAARPLWYLLAPATPLANAVPVAVRTALALVTVLGLGAFAWPRSSLHGFGVLAASLVAGEMLGRYGGAPARDLAPGLAVLGVLAAGEWLTRRLRAPR